MVEFDLKIHPKQRVGYFKKEIVDQLGTNLKILSHGRALVAYPDGEDPRIVIRSIETIIQELRIKIDCQGGKVDCQSFSRRNTRLGEPPDRATKQP